jgi:hypothetical protein
MFNQRAFISLWISTISALLAFNSYAQQQDLAERLIKELLRAMPTAQITRVNENEVSLNHKDEKRTFYLENLRAACNWNPSQCDQEIVKHVNAQTESQLKVELKDVVFMVRSKAYIASSQIAITNAALSDIGKPGAKTIDPVESFPVYREVGDSYTIILARDTPSAVSPLSSKSLKELGLIESSGWSQALANIDTMLRNFQPKILEPQSGFRTLTSNFFAPSFLFSTHWAKYVTEQKATTAFACIPAPDFALAVLDGEKDLDQIRGICSRIMQQAQRSVSNEVIQWKEGRWRAMPK